MDFSSAINSMMQDVNDGSNEPFIIYRDKNGGWHRYYTQNQHGETSHWVEYVKENDYLALDYKGIDFSRSSFSLVYDKVLCDRICAEYYLLRSSGKDSNNIHALVCFFNDNVGGLSNEVTEYLTTLDRPLAALSEMCTFDLTTKNDGWLFDEELAQNAVDQIEVAVNDRLHGNGDKITLNAAHCLENTKDADFTGKLLVVKADALTPEYRDSESQIVKCTHGNGARPNAKGRSIFCKELASNNTAVYYRNEIEGIANIEKLPLWAKQKLAKQEAAQSMETIKVRGKIPSLLCRLDQAKAEAAALNARRNDTPKTIKREVEVI
jgi:hypothetical protein